MELVVGLPSALHRHVVDLAATQERPADALIGTIIEQHFERRARPSKALIAYRKRGQEQRQLVHRMWGEGASIKEIARAGETTPRAIQAMLQKMRAEGWDLPRRRQPRIRSLAEEGRVWREQNPEKVHAHRQLRNAIRRGEIDRPSVCERCDLIGDVHGHHADYSKPLEVEWLCASCHTTRHAEAVV